MRLTKSDTKKDQPAKISLDRLGWIIVFVIVSIVCLRWTQLNDLTSLTSSWYGFFSGLGKLFGLVGFALFSLNFLLSTRRNFLEALFGGLNKVYMAHHIIGGVSVVMILFHPLFLAIRYISVSLIDSYSTAAESLLPRAVSFSDLQSYEFREAISINAGILAFVGVFAALYITYFVYLPYRIWLFTHRFLGLAFALSVIHVLMIPSDVYSDPLLRSMVLVLSLVGLISFIYRSLLPNIFVKRFKFNVKNVEKLHTGVKIELSPIQSKLDFKPGQFIFIKFLGAKKHGIAEEFHPFSIASAPNQTDLALYVKSLGDYTKNLYKLPPGTLAEIEGAYGRFTPADYGKRDQLWIAGGIGITPFLGLAKMASKLPSKVDLIHSVNSKHELIEPELLNDVASSNSTKFSYKAYIKDQTNKYLDLKYIIDNYGDISNKEIFICGPPAMMSSLKTQMIKAGINEKQIHDEAFSY